MAAAEMFSLAIYETNSLVSFKPLHKYPLVNALVSAPYFKLQSAPLLSICTLQIFLFLLHFNSTSSFLSNDGINL